MSYDTVEAGALAVLRKHADFDATNTSQGTWLVLAAGKDRVAVMTFISDAPEHVTFSVIQHEWQTAIDLMVPWSGEQETHEAALRAEVQTVVDTFRQWPKLDGVSGVTLARLQGVETATPMTSRSGRWRGVRLVLTTQETQEASFSE